MMRSKNNLKKFGHIPKSNSQKHAYESRVLGEQRRGGTTAEDLISGDFADTTDVDGEIVEGEQIGKKEKPYMSRTTYFIEHWPKFLIGLLTIVVIPLFGRLWFTVDRHDTAIAVQQSRIDTIEKNIENLQDKTDVMNDRSVKTETVVENLEKYLYQVLGLKRGD